MSRIITYILVFLLTPLPALATNTNMLVTFASCTGRFSAELEHAWLMHTEHSEEIAHRRQQFIDLVDAMAPDESRRQMLHFRIEAKLAHASLLSQASFSEDEDRARWAMRRATSEVNYCAGFLLDS